MDLLGTTSTGNDMSFWILPMATAIGAFGGFPTPPQFFQDLAGNEIFQWLMVLNLIWQGGGGQNIRVSLIATLALFIGSKLFQLREVAAPAPAPPAPEEVAAAAEAAEKFYNMY